MKERDNTAREVWERVKEGMTNLQKETKAKEWGGKDVERN
jgi:hypothetical protein